MSQFRSRPSERSTAVPELEVDQNSLSVYQAVIVRCGTTTLWKVEEHKQAADFLKLHVTVCVFLVENKLIDFVERKGRFQICLSGNQDISQLV